MSPALHLCESLGGNLTHWGFQTNEDKSGTWYHVTGNRRTGFAYETRLNYDPTSDIGYLTDTASAAWTRRSTWAPWLLLCLRRASRGASGRQDCRTWVRAAVVALVSLGVLPDAALPMVDAMGP
jgi:hypothetical protein